MQRPFLALQNRIRSSLNVQLLLLVLAVTFVLVGSGAWLVHLLVVNRLSEMADRNLINTAETFEVALNRVFMTQDTEQLKNALLDIGVLHQASAVRLLSIEGEVLASSIPDENGIVLDTRDAPCQTCHQPDGAQVPISEVEYLSTESSRTAFVANRIENRIVCQECHQKDGPTLGVLLVEFPAQPMDSWQMPFDTGLVLGSILISLLISGLIYMPLSRLVLRPIKSLARQVPSQVVKTGENDLQRIQNGIETLEGEVKEWAGRLADQHRKIDTIFSLKYDIDNPPSLEKFFSQSISLVQQVTGYETVTIRLYEPRTQSFRVMAQTGMSPAMLRDLKVIPAGAGFHGEVVQTRLPACTSDMANDPRMTSTAPMQEGYQSLACIPLLAHDNLVGTMQIAMKVRHAWDEDELRWLGLIGRRIGLLIQQIQLAERLQDMAVLEERSRIAQEIHDGLAQLIGSLRLWADEALISLEEGNPSGAQKTLRKIENAASEAYASLRDEMLGLRDTILPSQDMVKVVEDYLKRFQRQWGIQTRLTIDKTNGSRPPWPISPTGEIQLLRIIQEGLTNVRRHAAASSISVILSSTDQRLKVIIQDDGVGFDSVRIPENRLGLRIMRERAASVGGSVQIASEVGQGTRLEIDIPLRTAHTIQ